MTVQDRRIKRTQEALFAALIDLTLEKGYEAVTIRDITQRADIGYATFFRHYTDKSALLRDVLGTVFSELTQLLPLSFDADSAALGITLFQYIEEHRDVVRVLVSSGETSLLVKQVTAMSIQNAEERELARNALVPFEIAMHHLVASTIMLVQWWLEHDMPYSPEQMGQIYQELIARPTGLTCSPPG